MQVVRTKKEFLKLLNPSQINIIQWFEDALSNNWRYSKKTNDGCLIYPKQNATSSRHQFWCLPRHPTVTVPVVGHEALRTFQGTWIRMTFVRAARATTVF
jgi:hypothetical protein